MKIEKSASLKSMCDENVAVTFFIYDLTEE